MWLSRNDLTRTDKLFNDHLNSLANDDRNWGGDVNAGGYRLSNVILDGSGGFTYTLSPISVTQGSDGESRLELRSGSGAASLLRWTLTKDATAESGANAGSNFRLNRYKDDGTLLAPALTINRATGLVGIGTAAPAAQLEVWSTVGAISAVGIGLQGTLHTYRVNGTQAVPTAVLSGNWIGQIDAHGYTGSAMSGGRAGMWMFAAENWTPSANGAYLALETTPIGSVTVAERMRIDAAGNIGIGTTTPSIGAFVDSTRQYVTIKGSTGSGVFELAHGAADAAGVQIGQIAFTDPNISAAAKRSAAIVVLTDGTTPNDRGGQINFSTKPDGGSLLNRMYLTSGGRLGIGIVPTTYLLEVAGDLNITGTYRVNGVPLSSGGGGGSANYWVNGALVGTQPTLNLIAGTNVTLGSVNNTGASRVDVTITSSGAGGGSPQTPWASNINAAGFNLTGVGAVGIGTAGPLAPLHVAAAADGYLARINGPTAGFFIYSVGADYQIGTSGAGALQFDTNLTERMRISAAGQVGIGTPSPADMLTLVPVAYSANVNGGIRMQTLGNEWYYRMVIKSDSGGGPRWALDVNAVEVLAVTANGLGIGMIPAAGHKLDVTGGIWCTGSYRALSKYNVFGISAGATTALASSDANVCLYDNGSNNWAGIGADSGGVMWFRTGLAGTPDARMVIDTLGRVGIAKVSPAYALDVAGDVNCTGTYRVNGTPLTIDASQVASGVLATARLGTGTANSSVYLRGDGTWAAAAAGSQTPWAGDIDGASHALNNCIAVKGPAGSPLFGAASLSYAPGSLGPATGCLAFGSGTNSTIALYVRCPDGIIRIAVFTLT